jgi:O-antigen ligase
MLQWAAGGSAGALLGLYALVFAGLPAPWSVLSLGVVLSLLLVLIIRQVRKLLLAVVILDIPFKVNIFLGHRPDAQLGTLPGWSLSLTTIALVGLYGLWIAEGLARNPGMPRPAFRRSLPPALYLGCALLSLAAAREIMFALFAIFLYAQLLLVYLYIASWVRTRQEVLFVVTLLLVGLILESLLIIISQATGHSFDLGFLSSRVDSTVGAAGELTRSAGTVGSPNTAAIYLTLLLAPALGLVLTRLGRWYRGLGALAFGLGTVALIFTFSRGGWAAFAVSLVVFCILAWWRGWLAPGVPLLIAVMGGLVVTLFQDAILARLLSADNAAAASRIPLMQIAVLMIRDHPLLGVGANNFAVAMAPYLTPDFSRIWLYTVHNRFLLVLAETGIGGLGAFLALLALTVRQGWRCAKQADPLLAPLAAGVMAAILGDMTQMLVDVYNAPPQLQLLWLIAGLAVALPGCLVGEADCPNGIPETIGG